MMEIEPRAPANHPGSWPLSFADVLAAEGRIRAYVPPTPLRRYAPLDAEVGGRIAVWVKHENHNPTGSFKVRNAFSSMTRLKAEDRERGVVTASRGNHGLGVAYAGALLGVRTTICVPRANNPEKNEAIRGYGATLLEEGRDYDDSLAVAMSLMQTHGLRMIHPTNDPEIIAGAGTMMLEILRERPELDALVVSVGGGSQAVGALTVARALKPNLPVYAVQAARASATHDSWHAGRPVAKDSADTFADGLATRSVYSMTFEPLRQGLADFVVATEAEIAAAVRVLLRTTHNLAEGGGAAGLAGLLLLRERLAGKQVGVVISGGNIDAATLRRVVSHEI